MRQRPVVRCGDIGEGQREWEFEPIEVPAPPVTVPEPAPAEPDREPVPA